MTNARMPRSILYIQEVSTQYTSKRRVIESSSGNLEAQNRTIFFIQYSAILVTKAKKIVCY